MPRAQFTLKTLLWLMVASCMISTVALILKLRVEAAITNRAVEKEFADRANTTERRWLRPDAGKYE